MAAERPSDGDAVGAFARSLAHQIKNPLVSLRTFVQLFPAKRHDPAFQERFVAIIAAELAALEAVAEGVSSFAVHPAITRDCELLPILAEAIKALARRGHCGELSSPPEAGDEPRVAADPLAVQQAVVLAAEIALACCGSDAPVSGCVRFRTVRNGHRIEVVVTADEASIRPAPLPVPVPLHLSHRRRLTELTLDALLRPSQGQWRANGDGRGYAISLPLAAPATAGRASG